MESPAKVIFLMIVHCKQLKSLWVAGGEIRRRLVTVDTEPIVLMNKSHPILDPCFTKARWQSLARRSELPIDLRREVSQWNRILRFSFNCHALSVGGLLGMDKPEWLEGTCSVFTLQSNPTQALLDAHFHKVNSHLHLQDLPEIRSDDVVVYRDEESGDLIHSGRIRLVRGELHLLSKLGEHPAAIAPLRTIAEEYEGKYDRMDLYRLTKPRPSTASSQ